MKTQTIPGIPNLEEQLQHYANTALVVKVSGQNLSKNKTYDFESVCSSLVTIDALLQTVDSQLIVVHGAGKQLDKKVKRAKLPHRKVDGLRYTNSDIYKVVQAEMKEIQKELVKTLRCYGAQATAMPTPLICATGFGYKYGGRVGKPTGIDKTLLEEAAQKKAIAVVSSLGADETGKGYNINGDDVAGVLVARLQPKLFLNVTGSGGILADIRNTGSVVSSLNIQEAERISLKGSGMAVKINAISEALQQSPQTKVVITSPTEMVYALFEDRGTQVYR